MILKKEFYFVRHGQTDYNLRIIKVNHEDVPLNETGRKQALDASSLALQLPIQTICCSPFKRAKETKELLLPNREHLEFSELGECTPQIWKEMTSLGLDAFKKGSSEVKNFLERVKNGVNLSLEQKGPILIVAHGGVHFGICFWMNIEGYSWVIDNCKLAHFSLNKKHDWQAALL